MYIYMNAVHSLRKSHPFISLSLVWGLKTQLRVIWPTVCFEFKYLKVRLILPILKFSILLLKEVFSIVPLETRVRTGLQGTAQC
jgi:hypothetical protein